MSMSTAAAPTCPPSMRCGLSVRTTSKIWRATPAGLHPITAAPPQGEHRYADLRLCTPGLVVAVRERHHHASVTNELVMVPADGSAAPWPVAQGWDFYSFPRPSSDGRMLAWTTWRHPLMP